MSRTDHDLKDQLAECAFCGEIVARKEVTGKHQLLTVHMKKCLKHPMVELDEQYRALRRKKSGVERELELAVQESLDLRVALRTIETLSVFGAALEEPEHALGRIHKLAEDALEAGSVLQRKVATLRKGESDAKQGDL